MLYNLVFSWIDDGICLQIFMFVLSSYKRLGEDSSKASTTWWHLRDSHSPGPTLNPSFLLGICGSHHPKFAAHETARTSAQTQWNEG